MRYKCTSIPQLYTVTGSGKKLIGFGQYVNVGQIYTIEKSVGLQGSYDVKVIAKNEIYTTVRISKYDIETYFRSIREINLEKLINPS